MTKLIHFVNAMLYVVNGGLWLLYAHSPFIALAWFGVAIASVLWARKLDFYIW